MPENKRGQAMTPGLLDERAEVWSTPQELRDALALARGQLQPRAAKQELSLGSQRLRADYRVAIHVTGCLAREASCCLLSRFCEGTPVRANDFSQSCVEGPRILPSM